MDISLKAIPNNNDTGNASYTYEIHHFSILNRNLKKITDLSKTSEKISITLEFDAWEFAEAQHHGNELHLNIYALAMRLGALHRIGNIHTKDLEKFENCFVYLPKEATQGASVSDLSIAQESMVNEDSPEFQEFLIKTVRDAEEELKINKKSYNNINDLINDL
jgi:glucan biosynthesis protein